MQKYRCTLVWIGALAMQPAWSQTSMTELRARWNQPQAPFKIYGDTYYVGTHGLSAVLVTSKQGHVLIDGALPESAPLIVANIRSLGFRIEDVKLILNTHVHFDHAGGLAELQRLSGADVKASPSSAKVLISGEVGKDDPQYGTLPATSPVAKVTTFKDGGTLRVGSITMTPHLTPGHTPGGTSWAWRACEASRCFNVVYADSLNPIAAPGYSFAGHAHEPNGQRQLEASFATLAALPCDILLTPHPEFSDMFGKLAQRNGDSSVEPFVDATACRRYVDAHRQRLQQRLIDEQPRK